MNESLFPILATLVLPALAILGVAGVLLHAFWWTKRPSVVVADAAEADARAGHYYKVVRKLHSPETAYEALTRAVSGRDEAEDFGGKEAAERLLLRLDDLELVLRTEDELTAEVGA